MGEVFAGRYELIDPIGRGGVGAVWRAWDHRRRRYVAAKVLQQSDAHTLLRFVREQALRIEHPHVLAPASWAADDDKVLFTMDLVSGGSLAHVIGDYGPLPPRFVCTLLDQLLSGLSTVHAEGVVHRDIKPANILMEATGTGRPHLRLSDFGISMRKGEPRLTETNYVVGTPGYFAPEQMMGAEPDFPADLFAVGLVALYLLQGKKPDAQAIVEHFAAYGTPSAPEGIPEPLWQVLAGLLQPDPQARFRTATGARKALTAAVDMLPELGADDDPVEVFDQLGPLPTGFGPDGPVTPPRTAVQDAHTVQPAQPGAAAQHPVQQPYTAPPVPMSETGSFHLPPPPQQPTPMPQQAQAATPPTPLPAHAAAPFAAHAPDPSQAPTTPVHHEPALTRAYTAGQPQVPAPGSEFAAHMPQKRPGPPPKVAVPVLLVALICFAVGVWALTQS
ncbi:serine/threonine protein kinase [Streptomyces sp. NBC_00846]|uniref:serine/threonine-protein kinase n=1 Tax=Streptomyces sp. NBC_00846 TaxID=2975849 RepID=UPI0038665BEA|nr:serine/threonine protein kinase [Streptomyces sp. NBC_00846]